MRPDPKYVIDLAVKLEAAKAAVEPLQAAWDALFPELPSLIERPEKVDGATRENSAITRTVEYFNAHPSEQYNSSHISDALGIPVPSTRTNLAKLYKQGRLRKVADGLYQAVLGGEEIPKNLIPGAEISPETVREANVPAPLLSVMPHQAGDTARADTDGYSNNVKAAESHNYMQGKFRH